MPRFHALAAKPDLKQVGVFDISLSEIRKLLVAKHTRIVETALELLLQRFRDMAQEVPESVTALAVTF